MAHDSTYFDTLVSSSAASFRGNACRENKSATQQAGRVPVPRPERLRQKPPGNVPRAGDLWRQEHRRQGRCDRANGVGQVV